MVKTYCIPIMGFLWTITPAFALSVPARACQDRPGDPTEGYWRYHLVDGKQCWYPSTRVKVTAKPKEEIEQDESLPNVRALKINYILLKPYNWTSPYLGGMLGYGWSTTNFAPGQDFQVGKIGIEPTEQMKGILLGGQVGYRYQFNKDVVVGLEDQVAVATSGPNSWNNVTAFTIGHPIFARWLVSAGGGVAENNLHQTGGEVEINSDIALTKTFTTGLKLQAISWGGGDWDRSVRWNVSYHLQ